MLFVFTIAVAIKVWFCGLAAACKSPATAQALAGISVLVFSLYIGYPIPEPTMIGALRWLAYIN